MSDLLLVIIFAVISSGVSLTGGLLLLASKHRQKLAHYATAFAAGALLAAAFIDLLPEAISNGDVKIVCLFTLIGILAFFLLEGFVKWFHSHQQHGKKESSDPVVPLIIIGDTIHNFIDGIAIAAGFLVDPTMGIVVVVAVAAHEIPQEIGDFGMLLHKGVKRGKVILFNALSSLATVIGAVIFFLIGEQNDFPLEPTLALIAGFFIYIAVSDIIPSIHNEKSRKSVARDSCLLLLGVLIVSAIIYVLRNLV